MSDKSENQRPHRVVVSLADDEFADLTEYSRARGLRLSRLLRVCAMDAKSQWTPGTMAINTRDHEFTPEHVSARELSSVYATKAAEGLALSGITKLEAADIVENLLKAWAYLGECSARATARRAKRKIASVPLGQDPDDGGFSL